MAPLEIASLIAQIASTIPFLERRSPADRADYLEAVLSRQELKRCYELLLQQFGSVAKDFGQSVKFDKQTAKIVEKIGGIWTDQCLFFLKMDGNTAVYTVLWPWASDASKITLKAGVIQV